MGRKETLKVAKVEEALRAAGGIYTVAAQMLKCAPNTIKGYVLRHPKLLEVVEEVTERHLDVAEQQLLLLVGQGNLGAVTFYLRTKGRHRGYGDKLEVKAEVRAKKAVDLSDVPDATLARWADWDDEDEATKGG